MKTFLLESLQELEFPLGTNFRCFALFWNKGLWGLQPDFETCSECWDCRCGHYAWPRKQPSQFALCLKRICYSGGAECLCLWGKLVLFSWLPQATLFLVDFGFFHLESRVKVLYANSSDDDPARGSRREGKQWKSHSRGYSPVSLVKDLVSL